MEFIHDRKSNILFSLYGSKVNRIKIHNKTLTLTVEEMYQLLDGEEKAFSGEICFNNCDVDLCKVLIFNKTLGEVNRPLNVRPKILTLWRSVFLWQNIALYLN